MSLKPQKVGLQEFAAEIIWSISESQGLLRKFQFANLTNMNETLCYFDILCFSAIGKKGVQTVKAENVFFAFHVPPLMMFKNLVKAPLVNITVECKFLVPSVEQ